jgi:hypothetical protein
LGRAAGFPLPVQMPVFASQLDPPLVPVPVLPALVLLVPALVPEPAAWLPAEPAAAPLELPAELPVPELLELLLELEAGCVLELEPGLVLELGLVLEVELELVLVLALGLALALALEVEPETGLPAPAAPPVAVVHCVEPCLSQAGGCGSSSARVLVPLVEKVGLLQLWINELVAAGT